MNLNVSKENNYNDRRKLEITNIEKLIEYLEELKINNNSIYKSLINPVFQTLEYSRDPQVLTSSFDSFFKELPSSQHCEKNEFYVVSNYRNISIHCFISFTNVKFEYLISKNKFLAQDLLKEANHQLILLCVNVIKVYHSEKDNIFNKISSQKNFILEYRNAVLTTTPIISVKNINIHIDKIVNEITKNTIIKGNKWDQSVKNLLTAQQIYTLEKENLIFNIKSVIKKIETYQDNIGRLNIIFLFIDNYTRKLVKIKTSLYKNTIKNRIKIVRPFFIAIIAIFSLYIIFRQYIDTFLASILKISPKSETTEDTNIFIYSCFLFLIILISLCSFVYLPKIKLMLKLKKIQKEYKKLSQNFMEA